jgi:hypothetical protein
MAEAGYKIRNAEGIYFVTFAVVEWIDVLPGRSIKIYWLRASLFASRRKDWYYTAGALCQTMFTLWLRPKKII